MALPRKKKKRIVNDALKSGDKYLKYGIDRIEELMRNTDINTKYLPRTIGLGDIDIGLFNYVSKGKLKAVIDGEVVPSFYLNNERWGELSKTWKFQDDDKNVPSPYITVRRVEKSEGTRLGSKMYTIPQLRNFTYMDVPILEDGQIIYLRFKMPEPINVDLVYEVVLVSKYRVDINLYDEMVLGNFSSRQDYIGINGNPIPMIFESFDESNTVENIDGDKFFLSKYTIRVMGYIRDEKDYEIVKTSRTPRFGYALT